MEQHHLHSHGPGLIEMLLPLSQHACITSLKHVYVEMYYTCTSFVFQSSAAAKQKSNSAQDSVYLMVAAAAKDSSMAQILLAPILTCGRPAGFQPRSL